MTKGTKKSYCIDRVKGRLVLSKAFERKANEYGSAEYVLLNNLMKDFPGYTIEIDASTSNKETYSTLNYDKMEKYIREYCKQCGEEKKTIEKKVIELKKVIDLARLKPGSYGYTKAWFLKKYPSYKEMDIPGAKDNDENKTNGKEAA